MGISSKHEVEVEPEKIFSREEIVPEVGRRLICESLQLVELQGNFDKLLLFYCQISYTPHDTEGLADQLLGYAKAHTIFNCKCFFASIVNVIFIVTEKACSLIQYGLITQTDEQSAHVPLTQNFFGVF